MNTCPFCQGTLDPTTHRCQQCGRLPPVWPSPSPIPAAAPSAAPGTQRCPHCGTQVPLPMRFCGYCGRSLEALSGPLPAGNPSGQASLPGVGRADVPLMPAPTALAGTPRDGSGALAGQPWGAPGFPAPTSAQLPWMAPAAGALPGPTPRVGWLRSPVALLIALCLVLVVVGTAVLVALKPFSHVAPSLSPSTIIEYALPTPLTSPGDITTGPDGNLWFTGEVAFSPQIGRITPSGQVTVFPLPADIDSVDAITAGPDGNLWFTGLLDSQIGQITPTGQVTEFPLPTPDSVLMEITAGPDGNLWFTDQCSPTPSSGSCTVGKIGRMTPTGQISEFPLPTSGSEPEAITAGPDGNVWFTDCLSSASVICGNGDQIGRITPAGQISEFPPPTPGNFLGGITAGPDGNLWFTQDTKIGRITPSGQATEFPLPPDIDSAVAITAGRDGNLWFTDVRGNKIGRITPAGHVTEFAISTARSAPGSITAGPDGNLWFTEGRSNKIGRITP